MFAVWQLDRTKFRDIQNLVETGGANDNTINTARVPTDRGRLVLQVGVFSSATVAAASYYLSVVDREDNQFAIPIAMNRSSVEANTFLRFPMAIPPFFMKPQETLFFESEIAPGVGQTYAFRWRFIDFDIRKVGPRQLEEIREVFTVPGIGR